MNNPHGRPPLSGREKFALAVASAVVLVLAGAVAWYWLSNKPQPQRRKPEPLTPVVKVRKLEPTSYRVVVPVQGTVLPADEVVLRSRVAGEVIWVHPELIEGGMVGKGETLVKLDPRDYELALTAKKASLQTAVYELKAEQGQQEIARREWDLLGLEARASELDRELALRKPQLAAKRAQLEAAQAEVRLAELALERTIIRAPFNALIRSVEVDIGAQVSTQGTLARLVGTDSFHVQALVPLDRLKWIILPGGPGARASKATITTGTGSKREGRVLKLKGDLEPNGRLARLLIEVTDPMDRKKRNGRRTPMLLDDYVSIEIEGKTVEGVFVIERGYLRDGDRILTADSGDRLAIRELEVIWRGEEEILAAGIDPGARMVVSDLPAPVEGMKIRVAPPE